MTIKRTAPPAPADRLLHLAQPRRGAARRPHDGGARSTSTSTPDFDRDKFFQGGHEVLDAIADVLGRPERRGSLRHSRPSAGIRSMSQHARCQRTTCPSAASTTSASSWATRGSRPTSIATPSASTSSPTPAWRRACGTRRATCSARGRSRSSSPRRSAPTTPRMRGWRSTATACRTSRSRSTTSPPPTRQRPAEAPSASCRRPAARTTRASTNSPRSAPTATRRTRSSIATTTAASSPPATSRSTRGRYSPRTFQPVGLKAIDHIVANVEEGKMQEWVEYYETRAGLLACWSTSTTRTSAPSTPP